MAKTPAAPSKPVKPVKPVAIKAVKQTAEKEPDVSKEPVVDIDQAEVEQQTEETTTIVVAESEVQINPNEVTKEEKEDAVDGEWVVEKLVPYFEAYPTEKCFHITSDGQVFLDANKHDAKYHQKFLNDGKEVVSFFVEQ